MNHKIKKIEKYRHYGPRGEFLGNLTHTENILLRAQLLKHGKKITKCWLTKNKVRYYFTKNGDNPCNIYLQEKEALSILFSARRKSKL